jgi:hypothetical protein
MSRATPAPAELLSSQSTRGRPSARAIAEELGSRRRPAPHAPVRVPRRRPTRSLRRGRQRRPRAGPRARSSRSRGRARATARSCRDRVELGAEAARPPPPQQRVLGLLERGSSTGSRPRGRAPARAARRPRAAGHLNSGRPCWRVPSTSPAPRSSRSTSARRKPSALVRDRLEARQLGVAEQDAERGVLAAADRPRS